MPKTVLLAGALSLMALVGCTSMDESGAGMRSGLSDLGSSVGGNIGRENDTYGTQRRMDVYGASTRPSLPTIGQVGFGK